MSSFYSIYSRVLSKYLNLSNHLGIVWLILIFAVIASLVAFINPLFESTDEIRHYRYIRIAITEYRLPVQGKELLRAQSHHPPVYYLLSALASKWVPSRHTGQFEQPLNPHWGYRNWEVGVDNKLQYWHPLHEYLHPENIAVYIPRLVNVYLGAMTIGITYALAMKVWPDKNLALAVSAFVALNPQFIYLSAAINNDIIAALTGTAVIYICVQAIQQGYDRNSILGLGVVFGIAVLSKIHLFVLAPVTALSLGFAEQRYGIKPFKRSLIKYMRTLTKVFFVTGVVSGWWFVRNLLLYGDITGMRVLNEMWGGRPAIGSFWALQQGLPYLWSSLWGRFGYGQIPLPSIIYQVIATVCFVGLLGCVRVSKAEIHSPLLVVFLLSLILFLGVVSYYILIQPAGAMGRFLFPVYPVFGMMVVAGWTGLLKHSHRVLGIAVILLICLDIMAFTVYFFPAVSYPASPLKSGPAPSFQLGDIAQISDIRLSSRVISPGEPVFVTVTWHPLRVTDQPVTVYVHMLDEVGAVIAQRDTYPGLGRAPTTSWRPGRPFVDRYRIDVPESVYNPNSAQIKIGMYTATERLGLYDILYKKDIPEGLLIGEVQIEGKGGQFPNPLGINFNNQFRLVGYDITPRSVKAGESLALTLYWSVMETPDENYSVFAQVLDSNWQVWGSKDGGSVDWLAGGIVTDIREIKLLPETPPGTYPIQVGVFSQSGRLHIMDDNGLYLDNRYLLGPIRVE